jgi:hypothetical protein
LKPQGAGPQKETVQRASSREDGPVYRSVGVGTAATFALESNGTRPGAATGTVCEAGGGDGVFVVQDNLPHFARLTS